MSSSIDQFKAELENFVAQTRQTNLVWGLCLDEVEWLSVDSSEFENSEVMPFWSSEEAARAHCVEEWAEFEVTSIDLDLFTNEWMTTLSEDGVLVGLNWNDALEGAELEPEMVTKLFSK
ncbi:hypothetical protein VST7929_01700 [Vibrio stylophorae]|uniref:DUF2750 domain-containing protein n=1 Tax=Vibrio stylophorae TaxID=659351 RepID=A0ABM8ZU35_9VIBR|nr:DUF2750 domain-containing protein [Vibrio stylophorae]CAH0533825.1 hypothetical protein VST7929_01700 [Vibrio stylophorae]